MSIAPRFIFTFNWIYILYNSNAIFTSFFFWLLEKILRAVKLTFFFNLLAARAAKGTNPKRQAKEGGRAPKEGGRAPRRQFDRHSGTGIV